MNKDSRPAKVCIKALTIVALIAGGCATSEEFEEANQPADSQPGQAEQRQPAPWYLSFLNGFSFGEAREKPGKADS